MRKLLLCCLCLLLVFPCTVFATEHLLTTGINQGACARLAGNVQLKVILVDTPKAQWDSTASAVFSKNVEEAVAALEAEAEGYGVSLAIEAAYFSAQVTAAYDTIDSSPLAEEALQAVPGFTSALLKSISGQMELPVLICLPIPGRSVAIPAEDNDIEYAIVFSDSDQSSIRHELLHLFGARDMYIHDEVKAAAMAYFPDSIMLNIKAENTVDSFTAWCIGWTEEPDENAERFLTDTAHLTQEDLNAAWNEQMYTGFTTVEEEKGTYTGMLVDGLFQGTGMYQWKSGETYTGQWVNGTREGYAVYTWPEGTVYTGAYADNERTGKGTLTWPDGTCYTGDFLNDSMTGKGTLTWPDGNCYTGDFLNDSMTGKGILTWPDGSCYIGGFLDGQYHGQGICTAPDGSVTTGTWEHGVLVE